MVHAMGIVISGTIPDDNCTRYREQLKPNSEIVPGRRILKSDPTIVYGISYTENEQTYFSLRINPEEEASLYRRIAQTLKEEHPEESEAFANLAATIDSLLVHREPWLSDFPGPGWVSHLAEFLPKSTSVLKTKMHRRYLEAAAELMYQEE